MKRNKRFWALTMAGALALSNLSAIAIPFGGLTALAAYPTKDGITWTVTPESGINSGTSFTTKAEFAAIGQDESIRVIVSDQGTTSFKKGDVFIDASAGGATSISKANTSNKAGKVVVQAQSISDGNAWFDISGATKEITINPVIKISADGTYSGASATLTGSAYAGSEVQLKAYLDKTAGTSTNIKWESSDTTKKVQVSNNGLVSVDASAAAADYTITAKSVDYKDATPATFTLTVATPTFSLDTSEYDPAKFYVGDSVELVAEFGDKDVTNEATWTSSNSNVVKVDKGKITGVDDGSATITAKYGSYSQKAEITVSQKPVNVYEVVNKTNTTNKVYVDKTLQLALELDGVEVNNSQIKWSSSAPAKATINNKGVVTGVAAGTFKATATITVDGVDKTVESEELEVVAAAVTFEAEDGTIFDSGDEVTLTVGETFNPIPLYSGEEITGTWSSAAVAKVRVDKDGTITGVAEDSTGTVVTFNSTDPAATGTLTVKVTAETMTLNADSSAVEEGSSVQLTAKYGVNDITNDPYISYVSDDTSIATVDKKGLVTGIKQGGATITATYILNGVELTASTPIDVVEASSETKDAIEAAKAANAAAEAANEAAKAAEANPTADTVKAAQDAAAAATEAAKVAEAAAKKTGNAEAAKAANEAAKTATAAAKTATDAATAAQAKIDEDAKKQAEKSDGSEKGKPVAEGKALKDANGKELSYVVTSADASKPEVEFKATEEDKKAGKVSIPETVKDQSGNEYKVTAIAANAFNGADVKEVIIPKTVKKIGTKAFYKSKAKKITIKTTKKGKIKIGKNAFKTKTKKVKIRVKGAKGDAKKKIVKNIKKNAKKDADVK